MKMTMKHGALALALLGSAALFAGPTLANSLHDEGDLVLVAPSGNTTSAITSSVRTTSVRSTATAMARRGATITTAHPSTTAPASINADAVGVPIWTN